jgi:hypothetical protein
MWIYIVGGIVILLFIAAFAVTGILFFGALRRISPKKKKKSQIDTASLFPAMEAYREVIDAGRDWFLSKPRREVDITAYDGIPLHAEILEAENAGGTVLLMHGYRGSGLSNFAAVFRFYHEHGYNIVVPDERACGKSGGTYITLGVKESRDCKRWTEWIEKEYGQELPIFLDGISMGATTVLMATALELPGNVRGAIADCGFTSPWEIVCAVLRATGKIPVFPFAHIARLYARIFAGFGLSEASAADAMKSCQIPVFFAHGRADRFVPYEMTEKNFAACAAPKELFCVDEAEHGMCYLIKPKEYEEKILAFFERCLKTENPS